MKITRSQLRNLINESINESGHSSKGSYPSGYTPTVPELRSDEFNFGEFPRYTGPEKYRHDSSIRKNIPGMNISLRDLIDKVKQHPDYPAGTEIARAFESLKFLSAGEGQQSEMDWRTFTNLMQFMMRDHDIDNAKSAKDLNNILVMMMN